MINIMHLFLNWQESTWELAPIVSMFLIGALTISIIILITLFFNLYYRTKLYRMKSGFHSMLSPQINNLSSLRAAMPIVVKELDRSRRYQRSLSVVVLRLEDDDGCIYKNGRKAMPENHEHRFDVDMHFMHHVQLGFLIMGSILRDSLRQCDLATYDSQHNQFILLLPETNAEQAKKVVIRLNRIFFKRMLFQLQAGIAEFPEQGIVFDDLMTKAVENSTPVNIMSAKVKKNSKEFQVSVNS